MKTIFSFPVLVALLAFALPLQAQKPVARELVTKGFNTLASAVKSAGLEEKLGGPGPFTFFAPTDNAFRNLPKVQLDALLADKEKLAAVLNKHLVSGTHAAADLKVGKLTTLGGTELSLTKVDGKLKVNEAIVVKPDVKASNGVIHGIDTILLP